MGLRSRAVRGRHSQNRVMTQKTILIRSEPTFIVPMTRDEIDVLILCATSHYDRQCQLMAQPFRGPGTRNGTLVVWKQSVESSLSFAPGETPTVPATFRDLDRCLKLLERPPMDTLNEPQRAAIRTLRGAFTQALQDANVLIQSWAGKSVYQDAADVEPTTAPTFSGGPTSALTTPRRGLGAR